MSWPIGCGTAEAWAGALGAVGSFLLAIPYFVEWRHRRERDRAIKLMRTVPPGDRIAEGILKASTDAVLSAGAWRPALSFAGAVMLIVSFLVIVAEQAVCRPESPGGTGAAGPPPADASPVPTPRPYTSGSHL